MGGYELKQEIRKHLDEQKIPYKDFGCDSMESTDYPIYAKRVAKAILSGEVRERDPDLRNRYRYLHYRQ